MRILTVHGANDVYVDDEDYPILSRYAWHIDAKGYVVTSFANTTVRLHRMILNPHKKVQIDHKDNNKRNNQKFNLRPCDNSLNQMNTFKRVYATPTSSNYKGVHWKNSEGKWQARIGHNNKRYHLGYHECEHEAAKAYNKRAIELFGEFAKLNIIEDVILCGS